MLSYASAGGDIAEPSEGPTETSLTGGGEGEGEGGKDKGHLRKAKAYGERVQGPTYGENVVT